MKGFTAQSEWLWSLHFPRFSDGRVEPQHV